MDKVVLHAIEDDKPVCPKCGEAAMITSLTNLGDGFLCDNCQYFIPRRNVIVNIHGPVDLIVDGEEY